MLRGMPFSESKSTRTGPAPLGQVIGASGGCFARGGVVRSRVASVARWTLRQSAGGHPDRVVAGQVRRQLRSSTAARSA